MLACGRENLVAVPIHAVVPDETPECARDNPLSKGEKIRPIAGLKLGAVGAPLMIEIRVADHFWRNAGNYVQRPARSKRLSKYLLTGLACNSRRAIDITAVDRKC